MSRELQALYDELPAYEKIVWDALEYLHKNDQATEWSPYELPEPLLTLWAVSQAQEKTNNGGFQYFFENNWTGTPPYQFFVDAFERIGAIEAARALRTAVEAFSFPSSHIDYRKRRELMEASRSSPSKYDSLIDACGKKIIDLNEMNYRLLSDYIKQNLVYFPTVKRRLPSGQ